MGKKFEQKFEKDCIHLRACRRMATFEKRKFGQKVARCCDKDYCTAYQNMDNFDVEFDSMDIYVGCSEFQYATIESDGSVWFGDSYEGKLTVTISQKEQEDEH